MATSRIPGPLGAGTDGPASPRTPGPLGLNDQGDPNHFSLLGDVPGPTGVNEPLGVRIVSLDDLLSVIRTTPDVDDVIDLIQVMGGTLPPELEGGDFA
jgi:hypothetical protein